MNGPLAIEHDPFLATLRNLPDAMLLPPSISEALLHLPPHTFDVRRARQEHVPELATTKGRWGYHPERLVRYVLEEPSRRGHVQGQHASFPEFLVNGSPSDVWSFGMVLLDFCGQRRPIDVLSCIELTEDQLWSAVFHEMNLKDYLVVMDGYLSRFEQQRIAEDLAEQRARDACNSPPHKHARSHPLSKTRS